MKITPISMNNKINYSAQTKTCQPIKKVSFGIKPSKEAIEYLSALGADMRPSISEDLFKKPGTVGKFLTQLTQEDGEKEMSMNELTDKLLFYSTSRRLTDSAKAKFINEQIIGSGSEISKLIKTSEKLKNESDKNNFRKTLIECYISGAAQNPYVSRNETALFFNFIAPYMSFKEQTFCNYALQASV